MNDMPERVYLEGAYWYTNGDGDEPEYVRADLCDAIRQQALAGALAAVEELKPVRVTTYNTSTGKVTSGFQPPDIREVAAAIRRLMQSKAAEAAESE